VTQPLVDLIIAVHTPQRPIARAVASVLRNTRSEVRVSVVCHNTDAGLIQAELDAFSGDHRLRLLECTDGIRSPSGPFNAGLDAATAPFTSIMGSDDELRPGTIDSWLALQRKHNAAVVISRLAHASGKPVPTPPTRPWRSSGLDAVTDRLSYRSAPLGLVSRDEFGDLRLVPGLPTGEDIGYVTRLWFSGATIAFDRRGPAYVIHNDAADRVTFVAKPVAEELRFLPLLLNDPAVLSLSGTQKASLAVKLLRIHLFGAVWNRRDAQLWDAAERENLAALTRQCLQLAPHAERVLARADRALLDTILDPSASSERLIQQAVRRRRFPLPDTVIPRNIAYVAARDAPLRLLFSSVLVR
jgi:hypothetical protein